MGELFSQDPRDLLDCTEDQWLILLACAKVIGDDQAARAANRDNPNANVIEPGY